MHQPTCAPAHADAAACARVQAGPCQRPRPRRRVPQPDVVKAHAPSVRPAWRRRRRRQPGGRSALVRAQRVGLRRQAAVLVHPLHAHHFLLRLRPRSQGSPQQGGQGKGVRQAEPDRPRTSATCKRGGQRALARRHQPWPWPSRSTPPHPGPGPGPRARRQAGYVMLTKWLPPTPSKLPPYASHQVGARGLVGRGWACASRGRVGAASHSRRVRCRGPRARRHGLVL